MPDTAPEARSPKILVVDDEVAILKLLQTLLVRLNYEVATVENANDALNLLRDNHFDCVITDAIMPEMTGYDFVKAVRLNPKYVDLPILMLTRKRHRQDVKKAVEVGVTDYVFKPIDANLLIEKVELSIKKSGARPPAREFPLPGRTGEAEMGVGCRIASLGESSMTVHLKHRLERETPFQLRTRIFSDLGIDMPSFKLESCETLQPHSEVGHSTYSWEAKISFGAMSEEDVLKIREWLKKTPGLNL